ncbi:germ cell-less isoform X1 [Dermacentor variabilis]|uniref:germ cell-less isoform X1 n=1 Tax=Dermacentor variabilis TaxID=34621 RepID=UPI003F5BD9A2
MGNILLTSPLSTAATSFAKRKRKSTDDDSSGQDSEWASAPKRKKLMTTSQYIYRTLFLEGQNSDVTIVALGIDWCLHKVYLCQSPYFASMFCGDWKEKEEGVVEVGIEDPRITCDALKIVFGSLYLDEIVIEPDDVIPVLATATLFQLDELIQLCSEIMEETIKLDTVISYYEVAEQYALTRLKQKCFEWLERNLTFVVNEDAKTLRQISPGLMEQLVKSPRLVVVQTEFSLYLMVTAWTFLREHPSWEGDLKECALEAHKYFKEKSGDCFTQCEEGQEYTEVYKSLRIEHLINHPLDVVMIEQNNIYPKESLYPVFRNQWYQMLRIDQGLDKGPKNIAEEEFDKCCLRCGRILMTDVQHIWRWTGYNFGVDLIVTYQTRTIKFRRNDRSEPEVLRSNVAWGRRHLLYRLSVYTLGPLGDAVLLDSTGLRSLTLGRNAETKVLTIEKEFKLPIIISANFLVTTPLSHETTEAVQS